MKKSGFLNTVAGKYILGYTIVGFFSVVILAIAVLSNMYVSNRYSDAITELTSANNLEMAVNDLNGTVNVSYIYLSETGVRQYPECRVAVETYLKETDAQLEKSFIREMADANRTVESYVEASDILLEKLTEYLEGGGKRSNYDELENQYNKLQEIYSYVMLRFQSVYSVKLNILSKLELQLNALQRAVLILQLLVLTVAFVGCGIYLYRVIRDISSSIAAMMKGVNSIQKDVFQVEPIRIESNDEFDEFAKAFNNMTRIIQLQMSKLEENANIKERLAEVEIENLRMFSDLQKSHLDFLQSRINPHFLFNTLNMISSLARIENADQCAKLMEITASFLRYNLDNITKTVTLKKEIANLKEYVYIQECRYGKRFSYFFEMDESCMNFLMPCMILQPLVENAIQHGIAMKLEGGCVWIKVYPVREAVLNCCGDELEEVKNTGERICLEVSDNGVGMTEEQIRDIYEDFRENKSSNTHIGIRNIYRRLQLFYHGDVKFELKNRNPGLTIVISLPLGIINMKFTMIIADDEPLVLKSQELFIKKEFPDIEIVGLAENGIELKQMLEERQPDMAIVDIHMPGLTGIEVIEFLQYKDCTTHFIINTAYSDFEYVKKALDLKTDGYLLKPGKREESIEVIQRLCRTVEEEKTENQKRKHLKSALHLVNSVLGSEILSSIFSEHCDAEGFESYCSINNIRFSGGCIATFLPQTQRDVPKKLLNEELARALNGLSDFLSTITLHGIVVMFFIPEEMEAGRQKNWCEELAFWVAKRLEEKVHVEYLYGVGQVYDSFSRMQDSYRDSIREFQSSDKTEQENGEENPDKIYSYIERAKHYVNTYFTEDISLADCAGNVGISPYYLSHIFKERTGKTFVEYLSAVRIEEAKRLCMGTSLTIKEIAEQCGYLNTTYFCKVFKRLTGKTIGEYRRRP